MPEPLTTFERYEEIMDIMGMELINAPLLSSIFPPLKIYCLWGNFAENDNEEDQLQNIYVSIRKMPKSNHDLLERVFFHLAR